MKTALLFFIAVAAIAVSAVMITRGSQQASSAPPVPPGLDIGANLIGRAPLVTECFLIEEGENPNEPVRLVTDNFGGDVVTVINGVFMCEGARKQRVGTAATLPLGSPGRFVFECFRLLDGANPADPVTLRTHNFGDHRVKVSEAVAMCESARKQHTLADGTVVNIGIPHLAVWECYRIEADRTTDAVVTLETRNFGVDTVRTGRPVLMCEEARKHTADPTKRDIGHASGIVWECFLLEHEIERAEAVTLTTYNFGADEVRVREPFLMCERARKLISLQFFPVTVVPTGTPTPANTPPAPTETERPGG
jgi:hypothetical protein